METISQTTSVLNSLSRLRRSSWRGVLINFTLGGLLIVAGIVAAFIVSTPCTLSGSTSPENLAFCTILWRIRTSVEDTVGAPHWHHHDMVPAESNEPPSCKGSVCLDEAIGARLVQEEAHHLRNILDLVDGFGRPLGQIFDYDSK